MNNSSKCQEQTICRAIYRLMSRHIHKYRHMVPARNHRPVQLPIYLLTVERRIVSRINAHGRIDYGRLTATGSNPAHSWHQHRVKLWGLSSGRDFAPNIVGGAIIVHGRTIEHGGIGTDRHVNQGVK